MEALTLDQIKALRNADSVVFRFNKDESVCEFDLSLTHNPGDGFGKREIHSSVPVEIIQHVWDDQAGRAVAREISKACWVFTSARFVPELATVFQFVLKTGDRLKVDMYAGNTNESLKPLNCVTDEIKLLVYRGEGNKTKVLTFCLGVTTYTLGGWRNYTIREV